MISISCIISIVSRIISSSTMINISIMCCYGFLFMNSSSSSSSSSSGIVSVVIISLNEHISISALAPPCGANREDSEAPVGARPVR